MGLINSVSVVNIRCLAYVCLNPSPVRLVNSHFFDASRMTSVFALSLWLLTAATRPFAVVADDYDNYVKITDVPKALGEFISISDFYQTHYM